MKTTQLTEKSNKHERYFFDIPIFRCDINKWSRERNDRKQRLAKNIAGVDGEVSEQALAYAERWLQSDFSSYRYGEMIGMVRLYAMNQQVRGEMFFVRNRRISRSLKNKKWAYYGKLFERHGFNACDNKDIFCWILNKLHEENKKSFLKNRHIDTEAFKNVGAHINYKALI